MNLAVARTILVIAGFALWALTSALPIGEGLREGWDRPVYWQIGLPLLVAAQLLVAFLSTERAVLAPLWVIIGHLVAMVVFARPGSNLGLLPLGIVFVGLPLYLLLVIAAFAGRMLRRLTGHAL